MREENPKPKKRPAGNEADPSSASDPLVLPVQMVHRTDIEAYLMQPAGCPPPRYVLGVSKNSCPNYLDVANKLVDEINEGLIVNSRRAIKLRKAFLVSNFCEP